MRRWRLRLVWLLFVTLPGCRRVVDLDPEPDAGIPGDAGDDRDAWFTDGGSSDAGLPDAAP